MSNIIATTHAKQRMCQRGIKNSSVNFVLEYGKKIYRQGYIFHVMRDKDFPSGISPAKLGYLKRLVVVTTSELQPVVVTVYRSAHALRNIRKKSKTLL